MRKFIKIFSIAVISLIGILLVTVSIVLFLVFTPDRFTPIVRKQVNKFITCKSEIGKVELTFFSTFPDFGIKISQFALINPVSGSQFDTLVKADELIGIVDAAVWWEKNELILTGLELKGGTVNVFSDSLGNTNYNIFGPDTNSSTDSGSETRSGTIEIRNVALDNVTLRYTNLSLKLDAMVRDLSATISGTIKQDEINGNINVRRSIISFQYAGEKYLQEAPVHFDIPVEIIPSRQRIMLKNATASVNDLEFLLNGSVENDTANRKIITDISYQFNSWPVEKMLSMAPVSFNSYIKGIKAEGLLSSDGSIKGFMTDSVMPFMDIRLQLSKGGLDYPGFPLHLRDIEGDISVYTDLKNDALSFVKIREFKARTPLSAFRTEGLLNHLFTDIYCNLTTTAGMTLDEFNPIIPDSMKLNLKGKADGKIRSAFSLSQLEKMQLEKMKLTGLVTLSDFNLTWDSIFLKTDRSKIDFALPNYHASSNSTKFAFATMLMDNITAGKQAGYKASLQNASVAFETSDPRDTTMLPNFICTFKIDSLSAAMDSLGIVIAEPAGKISVAPGEGTLDQPRITLSYNSAHLKTIFGQNSFDVKTISLDTDILNNKTQKEIFLQWLVKGFVNMNQGILNISGLSKPVEIPSLKMSFDPETFNIQESIVKLGKSVFQLTGDLNNILSYFKGDSILKGKFNFISGNTDISQLMALTNGIGYKDTTQTRKTEARDTDTICTGPYMVPKRMDILLNANIRKATMGVDTATNINGKIQVHDGVLVLDGLTFDTPAARMQLTAIYRTPRKNHLFLGLDYQMRNIEISELLTMIPDIDTLMPMLRSFSGKGEFHIAVETYLDSLYNIKKSTLRGSSSISGNDLVLMDGETFSEIAKTLRFNKKTQNKVDTLSAEFTIFKNEIDVYPFLIVMDKYKAVIAGRHNLDMTFNYHISVVDCPLPIKLGVDIKGNETHLSYKPAPCRYAAYYRPTSRHAVESKRLELRKLIRDTLAQKVID